MKAMNYMLHSGSLIKFHKAKSTKHSPSSPQNRGAMPQNSLLNVLKMGETVNTFKLRIKKTRF